MSSLRITSTILLVAVSTSVSAEISATIMQIQGRGGRSPLEGSRVTTEGTVTLCTRNRLRCWIQDPHGDGDPATSDGIALNLRGRGSRSEDLRPGDVVRVRAKVRELQFGTGLPLTELTRIRELKVLRRNQKLPAPVGIDKLPDTSLLEAITFWEPLEGMRVRVADAVVVGPTSRFGEFVVLAAANAVTGSGYQPSTRHVMLRPTGSDRVDYNPERIIVDDGARPAPALLPGDAVHDLLGVVDYTFGNYKIQYQQLQRRQRPRQAPKHSTVPLGLRLATFNVENLFDTKHTAGKEDERSTPTAQALETKLTKLALTVANELQAPEIVAVQEVETTAVLANLAAHINKLGGYAYRAVSFESSDPRGIEVGVLWDSSRITLQEAKSLDDDYVRAAFGTRSVSPGREPLVATFAFRGAPLTVVVNHFKSKSGDDPLFGRRQPPERPTEAQRKLQAKTVRTFVDQRLRLEPRALIAVVGDLNDFSFPELGEGTDAIAILRGSGETRLADLCDDIPQAQRYSFIFNGNSQLLDHVLVSPALQALAQDVRVLHVNADFPDALRDDPGTPFRASDHDPIEATFRVH